MDQDKLILKYKDDWIIQDNTVIECRDCAFDKDFCQKISVLVFPCETLCTGDFGFRKI